MRYLQNVSTKKHLNSNIEIHKFINNHMVLFQGTVNLNSNIEIHKFTLNNVECKATEKFKF